MVWQHQWVPLLHIDGDPCMESREGICWVWSIVVSLRWELGSHSSLERVLSMGLGRSATDGAQGGGGDTYVLRASRDNDTISVEVGTEGGHTRGR